MTRLPPVFEELSICGAPLGAQAGLRIDQNMPGNMAANGVNGHQEKKTTGFGDVPKPFFIGVAGGTASGKSSVCQKIMEQLGQHKMDNGKQQVVIVSMEDFYRQLTDEEQARAKRGLYNFDHPSAFDDRLALSTLQELKAGNAVKIPTYDAVNLTRDDTNLKTVYSADVIIFEGLLAFYFSDIRELFNMKLFVDTDPDTRLSRRVMRDMKERGRDLDQILQTYTAYVKPAFEEFCLPTKRHADVIIPRGADNLVAIDLIVQSVQDLLKPSKKNGRHRSRTNSDSLMWFRPDSDILHMSEGPRYSPPH